MINHRSRKNNQVVSTFVGDMGAKDMGVDNLQYQMMVSSQTMPYDVEQVRQDKTRYARHCHSLKPVEK